MPQRKRLADIATRHQVLLERLKTGEARDFAKVTGQLDRATSEVLAALRVANLGELTRKELTSLLGELRAANMEQLAKANEGLMKSAEKLASYESDFEAETFKQLLPKYNGPQGIRLPTADASFAWAKAQPMSATGELLEKFGANWSAGEVKRLNDVTARAWGEGWTVQQLTQSIRGTKAQNYKDGILETTRRNAETVARTSLQHVASTARMATWEVNKDIVQGYTFIATLDGKTTQKCRSLDRQDFELGKGPVPPVHPNCRSTTIAKLDPSLDFLDEGATRSSEFGPVPANQSYYDWLKEQSPEFQNTAIGPSRAELLRKGGLSSDEFAKLNLGKNFEPLTLQQMQRLEPLAFEKAGLNFLKAEELLAPAPDSIAGRVWKFADDLKGTLGRDPTHGEVMKLAKEAGLNLNTASPQFRQWRLDQAAKRGELPVVKPAPAPAPTPLPAPAPAPLPVVEPPAPVPTKSRATLIREGLEKLEAEKQAMLDNYGALASAGKHSEAFEVDRAYRASVKTKVAELVSIPEKERGVLSLAGVQSATNAIKRLPEQRSFLKKINQGVDWVRQFVHKDLLPKGIELRMDAGRAFYRNSSKTIHLGQFSEAKTVAHELVHNLEYAHPSVNRKTLQFLKERSMGDDAKSLAKLDKRPGAYRPDEVAYEDSWKEKGWNTNYPGKVYKARFGGTQPTELLTMGIERLIADPVDFAKRDPAFFDFLIDVLQNPPGK